MTTALEIALAALAFLSVAGLLLTSLPVALLGLLRRRGRPFGAGPRGRAGAASPSGASTAAPRLSILKPLSGLDDGLEENLVSFARLSGISYEVVLSAARRDDPAVTVAERVMARFPEAPFRLVVGEPAGRRPANPKVGRLVVAERHALGDVLLVSDSNVRVEPDDVARTVALLDDPGAGCVSNLFVGAGASDLGSRIEALHLLTFVVPGNVLAAFGGVPCVVGKSMALRRDVLERIGGFAAFGDVLAEDQAIGLAVHRAGWRVLLSPVVVRNVVERRTLGRALARQVRWNKIRFAFSRAVYGAELLMNPLPLSLGAAAAGAAAGSSLLPSLLALAAVALLARILQASLLGRLLGHPVDGLTLLAMPAKDLLQLATQVVPYASKEVAWHGLRARIGPGTMLVLPAAEEPASA